MVVHCIQKIDKQLFIHTWHSFTRAVTLKLPEPARIRSQTLVYKHQLAIMKPELEFCVGYQHPSFTGTLPGSEIKPERYVPYLFR